MRSAEITFKTTCEIGIGRDLADYECFALLDTVIGAMNSHQLRAYGMMCAHPIAMQEISDEAQKRPL